jgi:hypothetical protein
LEPEIKPASPPRISLWPLVLLGTAVALLSLRKPSAHTVKKNNQPIHPKDTAYPKTNTSPEQIGFVSNAIPPPQQTNCPNGGKKRTPAWEKAAVLVALGIFGVNAWQSWETRKSADASKSVAETAHESLVSGQRAFVIFQGSEYDLGHATDTTGRAHEYINFMATWENVGTTSALVSAYMYNIADLPQVTEGQFTGGVVHGEEPQYLRRVIGPHDTYKIGPFLTPREELKGWRQAQVTKEQRNFIFFGWIVYRDVFKDTPVHVSEFCRFPGLVGVDESKKLNITFEFCKQHNCADEQCEDYKEIMAFTQK